MLSTGSQRRAVLLFVRDFFGAVGGDSGWLPMYVQSLQALQVPQQGSKYSQDCRVLMHVLKGQHDVSMCEMEHWQHNPGNWQGTSMSL